MEIIKKVSKIETSMGNVPIGICLQLLAVVFQFYRVDGLCSGSGPVPNVCTNRMLSKRGDIRIVISAQLHESKPSKQCDSISVSGFQTAVAVQWITEKLNGFGNKSRAYIPGVAIGKTLIVHEHILVETESCHKFGNWLEMDLQCKYHGYALRFKSLENRFYTNL